ncbi:hypothetical protein F5X97DRAFT_294614 [Nemania serpens]|nr:hypothetical protein F5X97DRAFT_294614 [Nemania serpens]
MMEIAYHWILLGKCLALRLPHFKPRKPRWRQFNRLSPRNSEHKAYSTRDTVPAPIRESHVCCVTERVRSRILPHTFLVSRLQVFIRFDPAYLYHESDVLRCDENGSK